MGNKKLFTLLFSLLVSISFAQTVQDFTGTDIEGNTHTLFDYLDNGQFVVVHFTGSW